MILLLSEFLYLAGKLGSMETLTYIAMWVAFVGLSITILGFGMVRAIAFPLLILAFIVPVPPFLNRLFTFKLKLIATTLSVKVLHLLGILVFQEGNMIDLGVTQLQVVDACSGLRYVYPLIIVGLLVGYLYHKTFWKRILIVAVTIPIAVVSNALRIAITAALAVHVSPEVSESFFHGFSGWLIFMISILFLSIISKLLKTNRGKTEKESIQPAKGLHENRIFELGKINRSYLYVSAVFFVALWGLNTTLASTQNNPWRQRFVEFPLKIADWQGKKSYLSQEILKNLWADDYVQITYYKKETGDMLILFVPYYEYQGTRRTAHSPVSCLLGGGFAPKSRSVVERDFPPPFGRVAIKQMVMEKNRDLLLSNYWFQQRGRVIVSEYANKWYLFWDSLFKRRTDGALVRLEMPLRRGQSVEDAQAVMDSFTRHLMKILPEYVPG
jgi:exosortase D (VPLPA-CTERM-specific)